MASLPKLSRFSSHAAGFAKRMRGAAFSRPALRLPPRASNDSPWLRRMVTVTQTKSSELPSPEPEGPSPAVSAADYVVLSEDLIVTPSCLARVERLIELRTQDGEGDESSNNTFLRVYVDAGGCSGFQYQFELDSEFDGDEDVTLIASADGARRIVTDEASLGFLKGSTLDYVQEMIRSSFAVVDNPMSESACGCGSSFAVKNFAANPAHD